MAKIGYVRCSTSDQNPDRQIQILKDYGCEKIFQDMLSGKDTNRPELKKMLEYVREGDILYVESISRLARSTRDLLQIVDQLNEKKVQFISQKENIDTSTPQGKFILTIFAALAELERENIKQRQAEGIAIAKSKGIYKGRIPKTIDSMEFDDLLKRYNAGEITQKYMCKRLNVSRTTLYRLIQKRKSSL